MARSVDEILAGLYSQAAEEIAVVERYEVPPDLEPRFY